MNKYELLYVVSTKLEEDKREELITRFVSLVTAAGGEAEVSKWGVKKLAYPINFQNEGFYVQMNFSSPEDLPLEIERQLRIVDSVLRFITVRKIENKLTIKAAAKKEEAKRARAAADAAAAEKAEAEKADKADKADKAEKAAAKAAKAEEPAAVEETAPEAAKTAE